MTTTRAAFATTVQHALFLAVGLIGLSLQPASAAWEAPWKDESRALVIDAYEFNPIDWETLTDDERIAGFINKASDGMPPDYRCGSKRDDAWRLCKNRWWKYSVTKELFMTRRQMAKMKGLLWGAYHLARPGNPRAQADHFIDFAEPSEDDLIALDIEDIGPEWMSLEDAEIFADQVKIRTGRYPVLYTNGNTAKFIADNRADYPLLSRLPLWYARYTKDISGKFPVETWPRYALWQFSSMHNCNARSCPYRVSGAKTDIDVNVSTFDIAGLKEAWPFDELGDEPVAPSDPALLVAEAAKSMGSQIADAMPRAKDHSGEDAETTTPLLAAYGPSNRAPRKIDPFAMLEDVAEGRPHAAERAEIEGERAEGIPIPRSNPRRVAEAEATPIEQTPVADRPSAGPLAIAEAAKPAVVTEAMANELAAHVANLRVLVAQSVENLHRTLRPYAFGEPDTAPAMGETLMKDERRSAIDGPARALESRPERSMVLRAIETAIAARDGQAMTMPALALSQHAPSPKDEASLREARVLKTSEMAALVDADNRILNAFSLTQ
ncbi:MAG: glycoside hydrolase family 25 protein [Fulvimarina manganoxydans]|uniref:glycoside hydrolase family 25 protein n=1 Tax=Fulvimarina manganoxydans TaxID=937218 RepID=UPI003B595F44|nr:glycoside hydrolase family 25 protein [Fulvimarina manganoxydans]